MFDDQYIARLNALDSGGVFVKAAALTIAEGDTRYYADVTDPITMDGHTYTPYPMTWSGLTQGSDQRVLAVQVTVPNVNSLVSSFVEAQRLLGQPVTLTLAHLDLLHVVDAREVWQFQILLVSWRQWATVTFTCGLDVALNEEIPSRVITRTLAPGTPDLQRRASIL